MNCMTGNHPFCRKVHGHKIESGHQKIFVCKSFTNVPVLYYYFKTLMQIIFNTSQQYAGFES